MKVEKLNENIENLDRVENLQPIEDIIMADAQQQSKKISGKSVLERVREIVGQKEFLGAQKQPVPEEAIVPEPIKLDESLFTEDVDDKDLHGSKLYGMEDEEEYYATNSNDNDSDASDNGSVTLDGIDLTLDIVTPLIRDTDSVRGTGKAKWWWIVTMGTYFACHDFGAACVPSVDVNPKIPLNMWHDLGAWLGGEWARTADSRTNFNRHYGDGLFEPVEFKPVNLALYPTNQVSGMGLIPSIHTVELLSGHYPAGTGQSTKTLCNDIDSNKVVGKDQYGNRIRVKDVSCDILSNPNTVVDVASGKTAADIKDWVGAYIKANPERFNVVVAGKVSNINVNTQSQQSSGASTQQAQPSTPAPQAQPAVNTLDLSSRVSQDTFDEIDWSDVLATANESLEESSDDWKKYYGTKKWDIPSPWLKAEKEQEKELIEKMKAAYRKEMMLDECCDLTPDMRDEKYVQKVCCLNSWSPKKFNYFVFDIYEV